MPDHKLPVPSLFAHYVIPVLVLLFGLLLTRLAQLEHVRQAQQYAQQQFEFQAREVAQRISRQLQSHEQILLGAAALFAASEQVTREEWRAYVQPLRLDTNYPGIAALGYVELIEDKHRLQHEQAVQAEGFSQYQIFPSGHRERYGSILYIEPFDSINQRAFGYDMLSEPTRRASMERARQTGNPSLSNKVYLVQDAQAPQLGFLMHVPVFKTAPSDNHDWSNLRGYVYSAYRANQLLDSLLGKKPDNQPGFRLYDGEIRAENLLYQWGESSQLDHDNLPKIRQQQFNQQHLWSLEFSASDSILQQLDAGYDLLLLGSLCSLLLAGMVWSLGNQKQRALRLAHQMTDTIRQNERRLRDSEQQFRSLVTNLPVAVYRCSLTPPYPLVYISDGIRDLTGHTAQHFIEGQSAQYLQQIHPDDRSNYLAWQHCCQNPTTSAVRSQQYRLLKDPNQIVWVEEHRQLQINPEGQAEWLDGLIIDISQRKRVEQMKAEFVATVSHELRTPLTSISGALGLLTGGITGVLPEASLKLLQIAEKNSRRLSTLINDLLDMEKISSGHLNLHLQACSLQEQLQLCLESNQSFADSYQVKLELQMPSDPCWIQADPERLQQVLANLVSNAIKYSPTDGSVELRLLIGDVARIEVQDRGPGISEEFRSRIFGKFSQADSSDSRQKGGTGLGLAISRELTERMGGQIGFDSVSGQGSCFYVEFPVLVTESQHYGHILVVEDEADIAQLLQQMLESAGFRVDIAHTAQQARQQLQAQAYDAMTLDLNLPDEPGLQLLQSLRTVAATQHLPVLIISAQQRPGLQTDPELGILGWLGKPFDRQQLLSILSLPTDNGLPRVLQVEDDADLSQVVATLGQEFAQFDQATSLSQARKLLSHHQYQLVILDLKLPDGSGLELLADLHQQSPEPDILVLSSEELNERQQHLVTAALTKSRTSNEQLLSILKRLVHRPKTS